MGFGAPSAPRYTPPPAPKPVVAAAPAAVVAAPAVAAPVGNKDAENLQAQSQKRRKTPDQQTATILTDTGVSSNTKSLLGQ